MSIEDAVEYAIAECIEEGILSEFLSKHRAEAKSVSIYEYDEEKHMRMEREESYNAGKVDGYKDGERDKLLELVKKKIQKGKNIEEIAEALEEEPDVIKKMIESIKEM